MVEIGAGTGEAAFALARSHPEVMVVACEVHRSSLAGLLVRAGTAEMANLFVHGGDGRDILADAVRSSTLAGVRAFFPDPWPKRRHHHRRLVTAPFVALVADRLRPGATLELATDDAGYAHAIRIALSSEPRLAPADSPFGPRPESHYARCAATAGRTTFDFDMARRSPVASSSNE